MICGQSWGSQETGWTWCCLDRHHPGICVNSVLGPKPEAALTYDQQPEAAAFILKQTLDQARVDERKK